MSPHEDVNLHKALAVAGTQEQMSEAVYVRKDSCEVVLGM